jgi:hypothetical protein
VLPGVHEDVRERPAHLEWRAQQVQVVAVAKHRAPPPGDSLQRPGDPRGQRHHAASERAPVRGFDEGVEVISLERVLEEAEVAALGPAAEGALESAGQAALAQRGQARAELQRHVAGQVSRDVRPGAVAHPRIRSGLPPSAGSRAAAAREEGTLCCVHT